MAQTNPSGVDDESSEQAAAGNTSGESSAADVWSPRTSESLDAGERAEVLARDEYRCRVCGREGPERGGLATLHVHHIERDPDGLDEDAPENLTTLCRSCHNWIHQQATRDDAPVTLTEEDLGVLLSQDIEILQYLADEGPATTGEVARALTADLSVTAVRERLAVLMGLDRIVESRDRQIIDQDVESGRWGLVGQIEHSARGHIPTDPQSLIQRVEDELVRQALDRGCNRQEIMDVFDVSRRTTFHREKRARAYDFPLDAFRGGGGRPTHYTRPETTSGEDSEQQRLNTAREDTDDGIPDEAEQRNESDQQGSVDTNGETTPVGTESEIQQQLEAAISALQRINAAL